MLNSVSTEATHPSTNHSHHGLTLSMLQNWYLCTYLAPPMGVFQRETHPASQIHYNSTKQTPLCLQALPTPSSHKPNFTFGAPLSLKVSYFATLFIFKLTTIWTNWRMNSMHKYAKTANEVKYVSFLNSRECGEQNICCFGCDFLEFILWRVISW